MEDDDCDADLMLKWRNLKGIHHYFFNSDPLTKYGHKKFIEKAIAKGDKNFIAEIEEDKIWTPVGSASVVNIDYISRVAEYGRLLIDNNFKGMGLGREIENLTIFYVFEILNMNKFWCEVIDYNQQVIDQHLHTGFVIEGIKRQHVFKEDAYRDVVIMGIMRHEYDIKKKENKI
jgi:RimJ/RimL family protein N-acetyltransferase